MPKAGSLASILGAPDGDGEDVEDSEDMASDFESAAVDAFPELEGQTERIAALKQAIKACMSDDSY